VITIKQLYTRDRKEDLKLKYSSWWYC